MSSEAILSTPSREQLLATNAWAFLHWLAATGGPVLDGWTALQRWSGEEPDRFLEAVRCFAGLPVGSAAPQLRDEARLLLHLDLRPADRLLLAGAGCWEAAARHGAALIAYAGSPAGLFAAAADAAATLVVAPAGMIAAASFRRPAGRHDLSRLRGVVALGGPLAPASRERLCVWVKPDIVLLGVAGDTVWGDPLSPVLRAPPPSPALGVAVRRPPSPGRDGR